MDQVVLMLAPTIPVRPATIRCLVPLLRWVAGKDLDPELAVRQVPHKWVLLLHPRAVRDQVAGLAAKVVVELAVQAAITLYPRELLAVQD